MRVERIHVDAFGPLRDLDTGSEALPRLVVVLGPNEAGKTSLFHFLGSVLYGFYPATREAHPYAPWDGTDISGRAVLRLGDGERWEVERRLLSSPRGSLVRGVTEEDLRNRTLPCVQHVPRAVFRQVYALTLAELAGLEGEGWNRLQDRLVGSMGSTDVVPAREAAEVLEREAGELWRPSRRGNQRVRELAERIQELRSRRQEAAETDRRAREMVRRLEGVAAELEEARAERRECRVFVERYRGLLPIRDQLERVATLEAEAGPPDAMEGIPGDPEQRLAELGDRGASLEGRLRDLESAAAPARGHRDAFGDAERRLLERADDAERVAARVAGQHDLRVRRGQLEQEMRDLARRRRAEAAEVLEVPWEEVEEGAVHAVAVAELRERVRDLSAARETRRALEEAARLEPPHAGSPVPRPAAAAAAVLGAGLLAVGLGVELPWATVLGAVLLGAGLAALLAGGGRRGKDAERRGAPALEEARAEEEGARRAVEALLAGVPVSPTLLERSPHDVASGVARLRELDRDHRDRSDALDEVERELEEARAALDALARELDLSPPPDPAAAAHYLGERLAEAQRLRDRAELARGELERLERQKEETAAELDRVRGSRRDLEGRLVELGDGDPARGVDRARQSVEAREQARRLRQELERSHPDLDEIQERIRLAEAAGEDWVVDDGVLARKRARAEELTELIESLTRRQEGLEREIDHAGRDDTVASVDGEILALEEESARALRARDRAFVLARLLREADRRFREEHQPELIRRAGEHLAAITGGRYTRVLLAEDGSGFRLKGPERSRPVEVAEPVSTGTREQVYLALRLAIVDHLDRHGERLPLFLDEAFVNWDRQRRQRGFERLTSVTDTRQVFLFTCHRNVADSLAEHGARVIELPGR